MYVLERCFFCLRCLCCGVGLLFFSWGDVLCELVCCLLFLLFFEYLGLSLCCLFFLWLCMRPVVLVLFRCVLLVILKLFVWCVSWFCAYVGLEGGSVLLILNLVLFFLLIFNIISTYVRYVIACVFWFLVFILLCIIFLWVISSFNVLGLFLLCWVLVRLKGLPLCVSFVIFVEGYLAGRGHRPISGPVRI